MEKLSYGNYSSEITDIAFSATNNYSDPSSGLETRKQLSYPLKEIKDFVNNTVSVDSNGDAVQLVVSNGIKYRTEPDGALTDLTGGIPSGGTQGQMLVKDSNTDLDVAWSSGLPYTTTAPSQANTNGLIIVYLESEPATKYSGYLYLIKE